MVQGEVVRVCGAVAGECVWCRVQGAVVSVCGAGCSGECVWCRVQW